MKKSSIVLMMSLSMILMFVACTKKDITSQSTQTELTETGQDIQGETGELEKKEEVAKEENTESETATNPVSLNVYSSNDDATGFVVNTVEVSEITPEIIVSELAKVNICTMNTEVLTFHQDGKVIELNLSKQFSNYLNMMGTSGEYIVMGSLVNTFLDAYDADSVKIMVLGAPLSTGHETYEEPLSKFEDMKMDDETEDVSEEPVEDDPVEEVN